MCRRSRTAYGTVHHLLLKSWTEQWLPIRQQAEEAEAEAVTKGLRVIVPVRAGYGNSDWPRRDPDFRGRTVNDMLELLDHFVGVSELPERGLGVGPKETVRIVQTVFATR